MLSLSVLWHKAAEDDTINLFIKFFNSIFNILRQHQLGYFTYLDPVKSYLRLVN